MQGLEDALGVREEAGADLGETDAASGALEQPLAEVALQRLDAGGHRRLGQEESFGGSAKALLVGDVDECFELAEVQLVTPSIDGLDNDSRN